MKTIKEILMFVEENIDMLDDPSEQVYLLFIIEC